ncbi:TPA: restriction endonuclease subunit S [Streptococcus suis]|nr:restriction endonuclease subunit S [Streptococcus suis]HEP1818764.1 restriction endonuclease subunit S [Streptococcus suis]
MTRMKDSGNPWVREFPSNWFEKKLRYLVELRGEKSVTTDYKKYVGLENIMSQTGQYVQTGIEVDLTENLTFEVGDILFGKLRPYLRKYWRAEFSGTASSEFVIIKGSSLNLNFLFWAIQSDSFINDVDSSTYGSKMPRASWEYMKNIKLPFPESIEEQAKIADFLDKKVAQLDKVKSLLKEQIKTLEDYRQSLIYETVTKGLDKTVPLKDSGVDWIGQIPEGWEIGRVKDCFILRTEKSYLRMEDVKLLSLYTEYGVFPHGEREEKGNKAVTTEGYKVVFKNDIVVNIILAWMGSIGMSGYNGVTSPAYDIYKPLESICSRYYHYLFRTMAFSGQCYKYGRGIMKMRWRTYSNDFKIINVPIPCFEIQTQIADFLDKKTEQINQMIAIKKEQIENINKQRQTLIYDYVTGKRRV